MVRYPSYTLNWIIVICRSLIWLYGCLWKGMNLSNQVKSFKSFESVILNENFQKQNFLRFPLYFLNKKWGLQRQHFQVT